MDQRFKKELDQYRTAASKINTPLGSVSDIQRIEPILTDYPELAQAGVCSGHYFHQDLLVANYVYRRQPTEHLDVGSRVDGFITHLLAFETQTILVDKRSLNYYNPHLSYLEADITQDDPLFPGRQFESISSLHAIEHMGPGRYGDTIDPVGHIKALRNLASLLAPCGYLYVSWPCGPSRVEFNSQRAISIDEALILFEMVGLTPELLRVVGDDGNLITDHFTATNDWGRALQMYAGCSIWTLRKHNQPISFS